MLIVITSGHRVVKESGQLKAMFASGLEYLHIRKPDFTESGLSELIEEIGEEYYNRIVVHDHHGLCEKYQLKGIHLKEHFRNELGCGLERYVERFRSEGYTVSSSFHDMETVEALGKLFDYTFLSPVFDSISKDGYKGKKYDVNGVTNNIVGLGGVAKDNIKTLYKLGYKGAAILGTVWESGNPEETFNKIYKKYRSIF